MLIKFHETTQTRKSINNLEKCLRFAAYFFYLCLVDNFCFFSVKDFPHLEKKNQDLINMRI